MPTKGLTLSDEQVFFMIQQTAEDAKVARHRTFKIDKKVDKLSVTLENHEKRICNLEEREQIEDYSEKMKKRCEDGKHCGEDVLRFTKPEISRMKQVIRWGIIVSGIVIGVIASYLGGHYLGTGGLTP